MSGLLTHLRRVFSPRPLNDVIRETVRETISKTLGEVMPGLIEKQIRKTFEEKPLQPLTEVGFNWALALYLRDIWPDVSTQDAVRWLREYIDVPHGHKDHDWNAAAAKEIAREYVNEVGELN